MDRYVVVKIGRPTEEAVELYDAMMNYEKFEAGKMHGRVLTGKPFEGDITVAALANAYGLELVCRVLRAAHVPYSLHTGKQVRKKVKPCISSTQFTLTMVEITAEVQETSTED